MGDSGEGLIDQDSRIQERMEELERDRAKSQLREVRDPERVRALVLCNAGGLAALTPFTRFLIGRFAAFFGAGERRKAWFGPAFRLYYANVLKRAPEQRERIVASGYEIAGVLREAWQGFAEPQADIRALASKIACPVWIAWAKDDRILAWSRCKAAAEKFPLIFVALVNVPLSC